MVPGSRSVIRMAKKIKANPLAKDGILKNTWVFRPRQLRGAGEPASTWAAARELEICFEIGAVTQRKILSNRIAQPLPINF